MNRPPMETAADVLRSNLEHELPREFLCLLFADGKRERFSYETCYRRAVYFAEAFAGSAGPGSRVAIVLDHSLDLYASFLGALLGGFVPAIFPPPSPKISSSDYVRLLEHLVQDTAPAVIVVGTDYVSLAAKLRDTETFVPAPDALGNRDWVPKAAEPGNVAFLQYSSGTTGRRKGVAISHAALLWQVRAYAEVLGMAAQDKVVSWLPLYHDMGLVACFLLPFLRGNPLVAMSPFDWVKRPLILLDAVTAERPQWCWLPNFAFSFLARSGRSGARWDLSSMRGWINCSEPITQESVERFVTTFVSHGVQRESVLGCYAMAETAFAVTQERLGVAGDRAVRVRGASFAPGAVLKRARAEESGARVFLSSGSALPETEVFIADESGQVRAEEGFLGEILVSSPSLFSGYDNAGRLSASGTAVSAVPTGVSPAKINSGETPGWTGGTPVPLPSLFHTGDLGFVMGGRLFVVGRKKDLVIVQGKNILPQDVEASVSQVESVIPGRCVAFGVFDESEGTERLVVIAETHEQEPAARLALVQRIRQTVLLAADVAASDVMLATHMWLAKSTSGKISRSINRQRYVESLAARREAPGKAAEVDGTLDALVARVVRAQAPGLVDADLEQVRLITDGWLDSLAVAQLIVRLETELGLSFQLREVADLQIFDTVARIRKLVERSQTSSRAPAAARIELRQLDEIRAVKTRLYRESARDFDLVLLGSSRCFVLHSSTAARFGFKCFNFSVDAGRTEDFYCMLRLVLEQNRVAPRWVVVGLDLETFSETPPMEPSLLACPELARYLELPVGNISAPALTLETRQDEFWQVFRRGVNETLGYSFARGTGDIVYDNFVIDGPPLRIADGNDRNAVYFRRMEGFARLSPERLQWLGKIGGLCEQHGVRWLAFLTTAHDELFRFLLKSTAFGERAAELVREIQRLESPPEGFYDFSTVAAFDGEPEDFFNGAHIAAHNGKKLFERLLQVALEG